MTWLYIYYVLIFIYERGEKMENLTTAISVQIDSKDKELYRLDYEIPVGC